METGHRKKLGFSHHSIHTEIAINAAPDVVWSVLTDTAQYSDWAAFMVGIKGQIVDGGSIHVTFQLNPAKQKTVSIDHRITVVEGQEFYWAEKGPGGIRDNHHFRVEATENGKARFIQTDALMGGITFLAGSYLAKTYLAGYQAFNRALKAEAERRASAG